MLMQEQWLTAVAFVLALSAALAARVVRERREQREWREWRAQVQEGYARAVERARSEAPPKQVLRRTRREGLPPE